LINVSIIGFGIYLLKIYGFVCASSCTPLCPYSNSNKLPFCSKCQLSHLDRLHYRLCFYLFSII